MPYLPDAFLARLIPQLDDETVTAIILHGSYARGDAIPPYSDVDLVRIVQETPERKQQKQFLWHEDYLLNLSTRPLSVYREWLTIPQEAVFRISTIRDAHILLDKEGTFHAFQQEALSWQWEPLQPAADAYACEQLIHQTEIVQKILRALYVHDEDALAEMIVEVLFKLTDAIVIQKGIIITSGNTYFQQAQEVIGSMSRWTNYHRQCAGIEASLPLRNRGIAALHLYQETIPLLRPCLSTADYSVVEQASSFIEKTLEMKEFS